MWFIIPFSFGLTESRSMWWIMHSQASLPLVGCGLAYEAYALFWSLFGEKLVFPQQSHHSPGRTYRRLPKQSDLGTPRYAIVFPQLMQSRADKNSWQQMLVLGPCLGSVFPMTQSMNRWKLFQKWMRMDSDDIPKSSHVEFISTGLGIPVLQARVVAPLRFLNCPRLRRCSQHKEVSHSQKKV